MVHCKKYLLYLFITYFSCLVVYWSYTIFSNLFIILDCVYLWIKMFLRIQSIYHCSYLLNNNDKILFQDQLHPQFFGGLGSFTPRTFYILAIMAFGGTDFPAYHAFTSGFGIWIIFANCYWFQPFAFLAWAIAILN